MQNATDALYAAPYLPTPPTQTPEVIVNASRHHNPRHLARGAIKLYSTWYLYDIARDALFRDYSGCDSVDDQQPPDMQLTFLY